MKIGLILMAVLLLVGLAAILSMIWLFIISPILEQKKHIQEVRNTYDNLSTRINDIIEEYEAIFIMESCKHKPSKKTVPERIMVCNYMIERLDKLGLKCFKFSKTLEDGYYCICKAKEGLMLCGDINSDTFIKTMTTIKYVLEPLIEKAESMLNTNDGTKKGDA